MKTQISLFIVFGILLFSPTVFSGDKDRQAKAAFDNAVKLFKNGYYEEAADEFRKANAVKPAYSLLFNIGQSEAAAKRYGLAYDAFEEYLSLGGDDIVEDRRIDVTKEMERLSKMLGSVEVVAPRGCTVFIDDRDRGVTPLPGRIKLAVGVVHKIEIKKDGETIYTNNIKVSYGELLREEVKEGPSETVAATPPATEKISTAESDAAPATSKENPPAGDADKANRLRPLKIAGIATMASGGAMLAAAVATGVIAMKRNAALIEDCDNLVCDDGKKSEALSRDTFALSTDVLIGVGATAAVVGTVLFVLAKKKSKRKESAALRAAPILRPQAAGVGISGEF